MGTATWASKKVWSAGNLRGKIGDVTMSNSYSTNGDTLTAGAVEMNEIIQPNISGDDKLNGYHFAYDRTNGKMKVYVITTGVEVTSTTNLSGFTVRCEFIGY